jgi:hypothetical protein
LLHVLLPPPLPSDSPGTFTGSPRTLTRCSRSTWPRPSARSSATFRRVATNGTAAMSASTGALPSDTWASVSGDSSTHFFQKKKHAESRQGQKRS